MSVNISKPLAKPTRSKQELLTRAHELWTSAGKPEGCEDRYWQIATLETEETHQGLLERAVGFEATLDFVELLILRYGFEGTAAAALKQSISAIRERGTDPNLYLAVVGEFSCGKSTLINALLRYDLLKTDITQGTTAAATFIGAFGDSAVVLDFVDGSRVIRAMRDGENHREMIHRLTTEENVAKELHRVWVSVPSRGAPEKLIIIDTPGLNAENARHAEVTERTVREDADAVLIVTPALAALSSVLRGFINQHLSGVLPRCAIAVTKIDLVEPEERERVIQYTTQRLKREFDLASPLVLGWCSLATLLRHSPEHEAWGHKFSANERLEHEVEFQSNEERLFGFLQSQRNFIICEKLARLLEDLLRSLAKELDFREKEYREWRETLEKNCVPDFDVFARERNTEFKSKFDDQECGGRKTAVKKIAQIRDKLKLEVYSKINSASDIDRLNILANQWLPTNWNEAVSQIEKISTGVVESARTLTKELQQNIAKEFHALFQSLAPLGIKIPEVLAGLSKNLNLHTLSFQCSAVNEIYNGVKSSAQTAKQGGLGAGAVIGQTLIPIPVLGAAIGAALGGLLSKFLFKPDMGAIRSEYRSKLSYALDSAFQNAESQVLQRVSIVFTEARKDVEGLLDLYGAEYGAAIKKLREKDAATALAVDTRRALLTHDRSQIASRLDHLGHVKAREMDSV